MAIITLQVLDEGINVLVLLLFLRNVLGANNFLLIKLAALDVGRQRRGAAGRMVGHYGNRLRQKKLCARLELGVSMGKQLVMCAQSRARDNN